MKASHLRRRMLAVLMILLTALMAGCFFPQGVPEARFTLSPSGGRSPLSVTFDASASNAPKGIIVSYAWDFGDDTAGTGRTPMHTYSVSSTQTFTIHLTVTDQSGLQDTATGSLRVEPQAALPAAEQVEFAWPFHYDAAGEDAAHLNDEYFALKNAGDAPVDLSGWSVSNERGLTFVFPHGTHLPPDAVLYVHSGSGPNSSGILYWNAEGPVWNNTSDIAILRNRDGLIVHVYPYYAC